MSVLQNIRDRMADAVEVGKRDPEAGHSLGDTYLVAALHEVAKQLAPEDAEVVRALLKDFDSLTRWCA